MDEYYNFTYLKLNQGYASQKVHEFKMLFDSKFLKIGHQDY